MDHSITGVPLRANARFPVAPAEFSTSMSVISRDRPLGTLKTTLVPLPDACATPLTVEPAPATAELVWQGRYLFFHPDEVAPLPERGSVS